MKNLSAKDKKIISKINQLLKLLSFEADIDIKSVKSKDKSDEK